MSFLIAAALALSSPKPLVAQPVKSRADVVALAVASPCARYNWPQRGRAPSGYIAGMALTYAKALCQSSRTDLIVDTQKLGPDSADALTHYGIKDTSLASVYTLMIGSGMRESSGQYCEGLDYGAGFKSAAETEAGLFQTSANDMGASPELRKLFTNAQSSTYQCFLGDFKQGVSCTAKQLKVWGTAQPGVEFQKLSKECPAFAAEYHAVMLRVRRTHYGPINTRTAEARPECRAMLDSVGALVAAHPEVCGGL